MSVIGYWIDILIAADGWGSTEQFRTYTAPAPFIITDKTAAVYCIYILYMHPGGWNADVAGWGRPLVFTVLSESFLSFRGIWL